MGYVEDDSMVRVDIFKQGSGKWVTTIGMEWLYHSSGKPHTAEYKGLINEVFRESLQAAMKEHGECYDNSSGKDYFAVCLEPWYEHCVPFIIWQW